MRKVLPVILAALFLLPAAPAAGEGTPSVFDCGKFSYLLLPDGTAEIARYKGPEYSAAVIPQELDGHPVTSVGSGAFRYKYFGSAVIPEGVKQSGTRRSGSAKD